MKKEYESKWKKNLDKKKQYEKYQENIDEPKHLLRIIMKIAHAYQIQNNIFEMIKHKRKHHRARMNAYCSMYVIELL